MSRETTELEDAARTAAFEGDAHVVVADGERIFAVAIPKDGSLVAGRAGDADIVLSDAKASRHHARVEWRDGAIVVVDLESRNGTKLGGRVLKGSSADLAPGDGFGIGQATLTVVVTRSAASAFVMSDTAMMRVFRVAERFARVDTPVLILGETGVGKEVLAAQIHELSPRKKGPFVTLNCAALADTLLESELFGHEKGAFTGADKRKIGFLEAASGGTLFLDELGDMPLPTQVKLLRFLESRRLNRLGSTTEITVDARVLAATHRDLEKAMKAGRFREDLFYRLSACTLRIPPLRERAQDIAALAALFAKGAAEKLGQPAPVFEPGALAALAGYAWPGNIRELKNAVEHAVVMSEGRTVSAAALPETITGVAKNGPSGALPSALADVERDRIARALEEEGHNQTRAATRLGISRRALIYKIEKYGLERGKRTR